MKKRSMSSLTLGLALMVGALVQAPLAWASNVELKLLATELTAPIHLEQIADGSGRMLVVQQDGLVKVMAPDGKVQAELFLDLFEEESEWFVELVVWGQWKALAERSEHQ